jgi:outer membrane protein assembly factor BamB
MNAAPLVPLLLLLAPPPAPEAWPQWRGPSRDGAARTFRAPAVWPKALKPAWAEKLGEGYSGPVLSQSAACLHTRQGRDEVVTCLDRASGRQLWQDRYASPFTKSSYAGKMAPAPFATPVLMGNLLVTLGANAVLSVYDAPSGKLRWRKQPKQAPVTSGLFTGTASSPMIDAGRLVVFWGDDRGGELVAFQPENGAVLWSNATEHPVYASPVQATLNGTRQYILLSERHAFAVDPNTGRTLWTIPYKDEWNENIVTPLVAGDLVILSGVRKPTTAWRVAGNKPEQVWANPEVSFYMSTPVTDGRTLYGFNSRQKGQLVALEVRTGRKLRATEGRWAEHAHVMLAGETLLAWTSAGELVVLGPDLKEAARYELSAEGAWAHPALAGRDIVVKDVSTLHCFRLP